MQNQSKIERFEVGVVQLQELNWKSFKKKSNVKIASWDSLIDTAS